MDDELVLLTSYFNLAGGRRQDTADTFRVDPSLASATSPDGTAALYIVTESSGGSHMGARARRLAVDTVAWEYASHGEAQPSSRLKSALLAAHEAVMGEYEGHVSIGMSVIAVESDTIYLGQVAPAQVYVVHEGHLHSIPANAEGSSPFVHAIGSTGGPKITVFRDQIGPDDVVALCSSWFHRVADPADLRECFGAGGADDIAEGLLDLAKEHGVRDTTVIVIEARLARDLEAATDQDEPPSFMEQVDTAVQALALVGRTLWSELRSHPLPADSNGQGARPDIADLETASSGPETYGVEAPGRGPAAAGSGPTDQARPSTASVYAGDEAPDLEEREPWTTMDPSSTRRQGIVVDQSTDEVPIVPSNGSPARDQLDAESQFSGARPIDQTQEGWPAEPPAPAEPTAGSRSTPSTASELDQVNRRIQAAPDLGDVIPPVQAFPDTSTEPSRIYATSKDMQAVNRRPRRFGGMARPTGKEGETGAPVIRPGLGDVDLRRPISRPTPPAVIWLSIVAVAVLAVAAVFLFLRHPHGSVPPKPYAAWAAQDISLAQAASTPARQDAYLAKARKYIGLARIHGTPSWKIAQLQQRLQTTSDNLHHISREKAPLLISDFTKFAGAQPTQIAVGPGLIFVLDVGRHSVFSLAPSPVSGPNEIVKTSEIDNGFTLGNPVQIAANGTTGLVLDDHNVLVRSTAGSKTATSLLQPSQTPERVVAMRSSAPDVYVMDTANNELWRYPNAITYFNPAPSAFFTPNTPGTPNLSTAVSFTFDDKYLYILRQDGSLLKFDILQANPQKFAAPNSVLRTPLQKPTTVFTDAGMNYVWVADPVNGRIVQLDKAGRFIRVYRSGTAAMDLHQMSSLAVGPGGRTMYVLAGGKLFSFPVVP